MTAFLWSKGTRQTWYARLEGRYNLIEKACLAATDKIRNGNVIAFAVFAKKLGWYERLSRKQVLRTLGIEKERYAKWKEAYNSLPQEVREQAEAKLPF